MTIETLDKAISRGLQVSFTYNSYDIDKKLHPRRTSNNEVRNYIINPYQIVATNGRYYLVCNYEKYDNISHYRLDRITNIKLLDTPAKPQRMVKGIENGLDLPKHLAEHLYMFAGESVAVKFIAKRYIVTDVIDWFGKDIKFSDATDDEVKVTVKVNPIAMKMWALKYSRHIRVIFPQSLVDEINTICTKQLLTVLPPVFLMFLRLFFINYRLIYFLFFFLVSFQYQKTKKRTLSTTKGSRVRFSFSYLFYSSNATRSVELVQV